MSTSANARPASGLRNVAACALHGAGRITLTLQPLSLAAIQERHKRGQFPAAFFVGACMDKAVIKIDACAASQSSAIDSAQSEPCKLVGARSAGFIINTALE